MSTSLPDCPICGEEQCDHSCRYIELVWYHYLGAVICCLLLSVGAYQVVSLTHRLFLHLAR